MATQGRRSLNVPPGVRAAIANSFDGDARLYQAFAAACAAQFAQDISTGQWGCDNDDLPALRRLAHNLNSALIMLGHEQLSHLAQRLEAQAAAGDLVSARASWRTLRAALPTLPGPVSAPGGPA